MMNRKQLGSLPLVGIASLWLSTAWNSTAQADPVPGSLRLVATPPEGNEVLPSERKALTNLKKALSKRPDAEDFSLATPSEQEFAKVALVEGTQVPPLPKEWESSQTVVLLQILPPQGKKPKRVSRGVGSIAIYLPPRREPVYQELVQGEAGAPIVVENMANWIARAVAVSSSSAVSGKGK